ncbi:MAG: CsgG/HfaB family protein [Kofleriaceae bacterium]
MKFSQVHGMARRTGTVVMIGALMASSGCFLAGSAIGGAVANKQAKDANEADLAADNVPLPKGTGPRKRVGIVAFEDASGGGRWSGEQSLAVVASDAATEMLVKSEAFIVIEREQLVEVLKEQGLGMTGAISPQAAAKAGQLLGLQAIITGKVMDYDEGQSTSGMVVYASHKRSYTARVSLRMIDTTTGEVWAAETGEGKATETSAATAGGSSTSYDNNLGKRALYRAVRKAAGALVGAANNRPWSATVAKVAKGRIYVVAGTASGLPAGAKLKVRALGEEITDPTSGQVIGREVGKTLGTIEVANHINDKLTMCVVSDGRGFKVGDPVVLDAPTGV